MSFCILKLTWSFASRFLAVKTWQWQLSWLTGSDCPLCCTFHDKPYFATVRIGPSLFSMSILDLWRFLLKSQQQLWLNCVLKWWWGLQSCLRLNCKFLKRLIKLDDLCFSSHYYIVCISTIPLILLQSRYICSCGDKSTCMLSRMDQDKHMYCVYLHNTDL